MRPLPRLLLTAGLVLAFSLPSAARAASAEPRVTALQEPLKVLVYWASWCANCPEVLAHIETLRREFAGRKVSFHAVRLDDEALPLSRKHTTLAPAPAATLQRLDHPVRAVPWVLVADGQDRVIAEPSREVAPREVHELVRMELRLNGV